MIRTLNVINGTSLFCQQVIKQQQPQQKLDPAAVQAGYSAIFRHALFRQRLFGYTRQMATLDATKTTNQTKLTLTVALTLTDTVTVIFYAHFVDTDKQVVSQ